MKLISILLVTTLVIVIISHCPVYGQGSTKAPKKSRKKGILDVTSSSVKNNSTFSANTTSKAKQKNSDAQNLHPENETPHHSKWTRRQDHHSSHEEPAQNEPETIQQGRGILDSLKKGKPNKGTELKGRGIFDLMEKKKAVNTDASGRGIIGALTNKNKPKPKPKGPKVKKGSKDAKDNKQKGKSPEPQSTEVNPSASESPALPEDIGCDFLTSESEWKDQVPIRPCHYINYTHPRQMPRRKWDPEIKDDRDDREMFFHLTLFNIKHDLDFQEAGDECSVELQAEFMFEGVPISDENKSNEAIFAQIKEPVDIEVLSYNRVWYKRLCSFFSYLECIPKEEVRKRQKQFYATKPQGRSHNGANDDDTAPIRFNDSGLDTTGLLRLKIGGRGPGKARHKSGPGGGRLDHRAFKGLSAMQEDKDYKLNGICVCSATDPKFPNRKRPDYGMDFVEDEARPRWCVAAPANLCGRVYFKKNVWPGQVNYEFSDHIGCPRKYNGEEYECVRWDQDPTIRTDRTEFPDSYTSTCEKKPIDPEIELHGVEAKVRKTKRKSEASVSRVETLSLIMLIFAAILC